MSDPNEEFEGSLAQINGGKETFSEDEQNLIDSWVTKLSEIPGDDDSSNLEIRNEYARTLARLTNEEKQLLPPFTETPPEGDLPPLSERGGDSGKKKYSFQLKKMPCPWPKRGQTSGAIPKTKKVDRGPPPEPEPLINEYEDAQEMAKVVARSKGQSFAEFIAAISRHTSDFGQGLRQAMKTETSSFKDYVDHVLSQRIKDLTEVLDEEQNRELQKIKKDIDGWQLELAHIKRRIKEIIPDFDMAAYKKDRNYLKKIFTFDSPTISDDDQFRSWREETCHRLQWISDMTCKVAHCNEKSAQEIEDIKVETMELEALEASKQQNQMKFINCELNEYQKLKCELDSLQRECTGLLSQVQKYGN